MQNYFNVPSSSAMTRKQAIKEAACRNWSANDYSGLVYQGDHGQDVYINISDFTEQERKTLAKHLS